MAVPRFITDGRDDIAAFCRRHHARRLELFGSATRSDFDPACSDLDFLVSFDELPPVAYYDAFFSLKEGPGSDVWSPDGSGCRAGGSQPQPQAARGRRAVVRVSSLKLESPSVRLSLSKNC
ncbi:nucleotidyltransferase family protein [Sphaerotilus microaerophilus]|uniref:nucleotidyltransferase family protein n=1 Tax=Sphaerotilus microaerophilus TaxID=2914710 RepID=UPI003D1801F7